MKITAIVLIVLGAAGLAYGGFKVAYPSKVIDAGPLQVSVTKERSVPIPPVLGGLALAGGIVVLVVSARREAAAGRPTS